MTLKNYFNPDKDSSKTNKLLDIKQGEIVNQITTLYRG